MTDAANVHSVDPYRHATASNRLESESPFDLTDLLDVVNPLQHIPGVNLLYRELTGDTITQVAARR